MIKPIVKSPLILSVKAKPATKADLPVAYDLLDTLAANKESCVGMAANMIGCPLSIICFENEGKPTLMLNPEIVSAKGEYETEEGCLSLSGKRRTKRYKLITVRWQDTDLSEKTAVFEGFTAEIIQHETDHLKGILI